MIVAQQLTDPRPRLRPDFWPQRHERIERGPGEHAERTNIEPRVLLELPEIEHEVPNRNADARRRIGRGREHAIRQILDREVGGFGDVDEGAETGIVGMGCHFWLGSFFLLPCGRRWRKAPDEGSLSANSIVREVAERDPHPSRRYATSHLSHKERERKSYGLLGSNRFSRPFQQSA